MTRHLIFVANRIAPVEEIEHDGKRYLSAPVVLIRAGVLNGMYVPVTELEKFPEAWNGTPAPLDHPEDAEGFISVNTPDLWASRVSGQLWNVRYENERLIGDIWVDLDKAEKIGGDATEAVRRLRAGQGIEVSTGYYADIVDEEGEYQGIPYTAVQYNIRPDHLALLLHEEGACNWSDGCGTPRVNKRSDTMPNENTQDAGVYTLEPANAEALADGILERMKGFFANREEKSKKAQLIEGLVANQCPLKAETLEAMPVAELETLTANGIKWIGVDDEEEVTSNPYSIGAHESALDDFVRRLAELLANPYSIGAHEGAMGKLAQSIAAILANGTHKDDEDDEVICNEILKHPGNEFTRAELSAMKTEHRRKLYRSLQARDYTGAAGNLQTHSRGDEYEELAMPAAWPERAQ